MGLGLLSLLLSLAGICTMSWHYLEGMGFMKYIEGIITLVLFIAAIVLSTMAMKKQKKNKGIKPSMKNFALMGHAIAGVGLVVGGIICCLAFAKYPIF